MSGLTAELEAKAQAILQEMGELSSLVVAFSGGVDSSVVAALAQRALGDRAWAVTAVSETLAQRELEEAREIAAEIGIRHELMTFSELDDEDFRANTAARCYFCQSMRFDHLRQMARELGCELLASGTNASDLGEHRPGLEAMRQRGVYQPLLAHEIDKEGVRALGRWLGLSVWDKPAQACLSSRIPHGLEVTADRLRRVERGEAVLHELGFEQLRVRDHDGVGRIEVAAPELERLTGSGDTLREIAAGLRSAGFRRVCVDLEGYAPGRVSGAPTA